MFYLTQNYCKTRIELIIILNEIMIYLFSWQNFNLLHTIFVLLHFPYNKVSPVFFSNMPSIRLGPRLGTNERWETPSSLCFN